MSGYTTCSPMYQRIILLILTVRAELFHLSGRIAGYSTCPTVCRDYTPLSDQSVTYFPWPTYIAYISILSLSQQPIIHKTRIPFSWINSKYFPVSLPLCVSSPPPPYRHTANKKGNINVTCATCIDPSMHIGGCESCTRFERKPIHFYFEKRTISFTVNTKKRKRTEVVHDVDYFLRDTKICSQT